jgi:hypothetical protein
MAVKDSFYEKLQTVHNKIPRKDLLIIVGDCNAKIGKDRCYRQVIGKYSFHEENTKNGELLCFNSIENDVGKMSTYFQHKTIHKGTWTVPDGRTINQIDNVTVNKKKTSMIQDLRVMRGPNCNSDHFLVKVMIK